MRAHQAPGVPVDLLSRFTASNPFLLASQCKGLWLYKYTAWRRRMSGDRLCLSAPSELLLLRIGINHLNNPKDSPAVVAIHSPPGGSRIKVQHPRLSLAPASF